MSQTLKQLESLLRSKSKIDRSLSNRVLVPAFLLLNQKNITESMQIETYDFITFLMWKMEMSNVNIDRNFFLKILELFTVELCTNLSPCIEKEELKLTAVKCVTKCVQRLSDDDFLFIYDNCFQKLSPQILICVEFIKCEKFRQLKIQSILCLKAIFRDFNKAICSKISVIQKIQQISPCILSNLLKMLRFDDNSGSEFQKTAIEFFGIFLSVQINDKICDKSCQKWIDESLDKIQLEVLKKFVNSDKKIVKLQLIKTSILILKSCSLNLKAKIRIPIVILLILSESKDSDERQSATKGIRFLKDINASSDKIKLWDIIEEDFFDIVSRFSNDLIANIDDSKQWSTIVLLIGYCKILDNRLVDLCYSTYHFNNLMTSLLTVVEFRQSNFIIDEVANVKSEFDYDWNYEHLNEKRLKYFENGKNLCKFLEIGQYLAKNAIIFNHCYDFLWSIFTQCSSQQKQSLFLINCLFLGLNNDDNNLDLVDQYLHYITNDDIWYLPIDNKECENRIELMQTNMEIVCLMLESIGILAKIFQEKFHRFLRILIYPVFERAGSNLSRISHSGLFAINQIALGCGFLNVRALIDDQSNYLQSEINRRLHHVNRNSMVLNAICVISKFQVLKMTHYFFHIVKNILMESCDEFHSQKRICFLKVFNILLGSLNKEVLNANKFSMNNIRKQDALASPSVPAYVQIIALIVKRSLHFLPTKSDRSCRIIALSNLKKGLKLIEDFENELLPLIHQTWSALIDRFKEFNDYLILNLSLQLLSVMAECSKSFICLRTSKDVWPQICRLMEKLSKESSHTPFEQKYKLQLELLERTPIIIRDLEMTDKDMILLIDSLKNYLSCSQPFSFQEKCVNAFETLAQFNKKIVEEQLERIKNDDKNWSANLNKVFARLKYVS